MDFRLSDEQLELQEAMHRFCQVNHSPDQLGALAGTSLRAGGWERLAELDVFRLALDPARGGLGLGLVDAAVVFEQLGAHLVPGPLVWSALAARHIDELQGAAAVIGGLDAPPPTGATALVEHAGDLDALLVLHDDGVRLVDPQAFVGVEHVTPTDPLTPVALVRVVPDGRLVGGAAVARTMRIEGTVLTAALLTGIADRAVTAAVAYTGERRQFGRPVGSFQAIKHLLADCYVRTSLARSALYAAAAMVDDPAVGDAPRAAAAAKLLASDAAVRNARACIQAHGGMGFTWEMLPHYLLKRAWVHEHAFGRRDEHAELLADALAGSFTGPVGAVAS